MWFDILKAELMPASNTSVTTESFTRTRPPKTTCREQLKAMAEKIRSAPESEHVELSISKHAPGGLDVVPEDVCCAALKLMKTLGGKTWPQTWSALFDNDWKSEKTIGDWEISFELFHRNHEHVVKYYYDIELQLEIYNNNYDGVDPPAHELFSIAISTLEIGGHGEDTSGPVDRTLNEIWRKDKIAGFVRDRHPRSYENEILAYVQKMIDWRTF